MYKIKDNCETLLSSLHKDSEFLTGGEKEGRIAYEKALELSDTLALWNCRKH